MTRDELTHALLVERFAAPVLEYHQPPTTETTSVCAQRCAQLVAEVEKYERTHE